ncbi:MarR family winged helix-turn-helix transcriptional regulator [Nocardioides sp. GXQ0305]|uniref:MarR family winged helix-turn-helix transcriptional regulator n=1 Tax=Nocardioides sp. GXQ0305 TaxID=3423912 RepID=UPI003D7E8878
MSQPRQALVTELGVALQRYQRSVQAFDDAVGRALRLNPTDLRCLDWLADGPKSVGELAEATGLRPAATTALVDRLSGRGLVRRAPSAADRRKVLVEMTEQGAALTWECYGPLVAEGDHLLADLDADELAAMRTLLDAMRDLTDRHRDRLAATSEG